MTTTPAATAAFAQALLDPQQPLPPGITAPDGADPLRRFNVYRNNVVVSLIDALATTFPVTRELVGDDFFRAMARIHVAQSPPQSRLLAEYGAGFPDFIAGFEPAQSLPYLADVARLEHLRVVAYHAADAVALGAGAFRPLLATPECLLELRFALHPACRWLASAHPVFSIWAAHQGVLALPDVDLAKAESVLVVRPEFEVRVSALPPGSVTFLDALSGGATLAEAAVLAADASAAFDLPHQLAGLIEQGLVIRLD